MNWYRVQCVVQYDLLFFADAVILCIFIHISAYLQIENIAFITSVCLTLTQWFKSTFLHYNNKVQLYNLLRPRMSVYKLRSVVHYPCIVLNKILRVNK